MDIKIYSSCVNDNVINLPTSKSITHRVLIIASFLRKNLTLKNVTFCNDVFATLKTLESLGLKYEINDKNLILDTDHFLENIDQNIDVFESGTTLRLIMPLLASLNTSFVIYPKGNLINRPLDVYEELFKKNNVFFEKHKDVFLLKGSLMGKEFTIDQNISSQFVSGLLLYIALINNNAKLLVTKDIESIGYINITIDVLKTFGININVNLTDEYYEFKVGNVNIIDLKEYDIEIDYSNSAFIFTLEYLHHKNIDKYLHLVNKDTYQLDYEIIRLLNNDFNEPIDLANIPDLGPILFVLSVFKNTKVIFTNCNRLIYKESNRLTAMQEELRKLNIYLFIEDNQVTIDSTDFSGFGATFDTHNDHRIAMSLSVISTILETPSIIKNADCVNKSYPDFFNDLIKLGINVEIIK